MILWKDILTKNSNIMKNIKVKHLFWAIIFLTLMTMFNTCNSCQSNSNSKQARKQGDTLSSQVVKLQEDMNEFEKTIVTKTDLEIQGLQTEKRMLINTNQIFLTKMRPDERILEIDEEIKRLEKEKE